MEFKRYNFITIAHLHIICSTAYKVTLSEYKYLGGITGGTKCHRDAEGTEEAVELKCSRSDSEHTWADLRHLSPPPRRPLAPFAWPPMPPPLNLYYVLPYHLDTSRLNRRWYLSWLPWGVISWVTAYNNLRHIVCYCVLNPWDYC